MVERILVICVGNICRSPMGEVLFQDRLKAQVPMVQVSSAGLGGLVGHPADPFALELMQERGLDLSLHQAAQATPARLFAAEIIFTMTAGQQKDIECSLSSLRGRVHRLGHWGGYDIPDPYRRPKEAFQHALTLIEQGVLDWCEKLWN